ncbi:hypothetical protein PV08_08585 [Exophiala spinifera]|uniref:Quinate transporter n=1 Tax=Exophiala spinifera TaxID=91928 RepID=A0A0D1ZKP0_9EURO|nr:uncharacterized protein PV08_08585 [Exophiala spinifera]KIW13397.1 hypothetical protein PV08_08585 [Exophiala spinifera]
MRPSRYAVEEFNVPTPPEVYNYRVYVLAALSSFGAFIFGYDLAFIGTTLALPSFQKSFHLPKNTDAFSANIVSLLQAGCFFGSLIAGWMGDKIGRKLALMVAGVIFCVGSLMQTVSHGNVAVMFAGRAVGGLGVGSASMLVPLYLAEVSPPAIRGRLVGIYEIGVQAGTCIGFWINYGVKLNMPESDAQWITPFAIQLIPGGLLILGMLFLPDSPRWYARFRGREAAVNVLAKLRNLPVDHPYIQEEMYRVIDQIEHEREATPGKGLVAEFKELSRKGNRNRIAIGVTLFIFMQMAGSNAINFYSPRIFKSIGLKGSNTGLYATGIYGLVRFVAVCIAIFFVVDRFGRTKMLIYGSALMAACMWYIGAYVTVNGETTTKHISAGGYAACTLIYVYAIGFCFSWAGVPWIYCSEIFPLRIRGICVAICTATHWLMNFVIARSVPYMISNIGGGTYFVFASFLTAAVFFVYFFVPETKGLNMESMDQLFGVPGAGTHSFPHVDEEKAQAETVETAK